MKYFLLILAPFCTSNAFAATGACLALAGVWSQDAREMDPIIPSNPITIRISGSCKMAVLQSNKELDQSTMVFDYIFREAGKLRVQMKFKEGTLDEAGKPIPPLAVEQKKLIQGPVYLYDDDTIAFSLDMMDQAMKRPAPTDKFHRQKTI